MDILVIFVLIIIVWLCIQPSIYIQKTICNKNVYVSLTSIYNKQGELLETLKSIEKQSYKPDKCFIYLSEEPYLLDEGFRHREITNMELKQYLINHKDLFELHWVKNEGPFRKLLPLLKEKWNEDCLIITIDDDVKYNQHMINIYITEYNKYKCCITDNFGFTMSSNTVRDIYYPDRKFRVILNQLSLSNFHIGISGVLYHPSFFHKTGDLIFREDLFKECCPTGDDIWFNFVRIANNIKCYLAKKRMKKDIKHNYGLWHNINNKNNQNTLNMQRTIRKLIELGYLHLKK